VWGDSDSGGIGAPTDNGYIKIYSTAYSFAALKADGLITVWGLHFAGGSGAPTDSGYIEIHSANSVFTAVKADGSIAVWGAELHKRVLK
jgi:Ser-tRNA(Ala) deacylase AlaX